MSLNLTAMQRQTQANLIARQFRAAENLLPEARAEQREILMEQVTGACDPDNYIGPAIALAVQVERDLAVMHGSFYAMRWEQMWVETQR